MGLSIMIRLCLAMVLAASYAAAAQWSAIGATCTSVSPPVEFGLSTPDLTAKIQVLLPVAPSSSMATMATLPAIAVCPGVDYIVQVTFPKQRAFTITSSIGSFNGAATPCNNRVVDTTGAETFRLNLAVPCTAAGTLMLKVASVEAGQTSSSKYMVATRFIIVSPLFVCLASKCPGAPKAVNFSSIANIIANPASLPDAVESFAAQVNTEVTENLQQQVQALQNTIQTLVAITNPDNALGNINATVQNLVNGLKIIGGKNNTGVMGLLNAVSTLQYFFAPKTTTGTTGGTTGNTDIGSLLSAVKVMGNLLSGGQATNVTPSLTGLMESGIGVVSSLVKLVPPTGVTASSISIPNLLSFVQSAGSFMGQLSALIPS